MATFKKGDMWQRWNNCDLFCITTNATIKSDGALVMGRGIAKQAQNRFDGIDKTLGNLIKSISDDDYDYEFYGLVTTKWENQEVGIFQVKRHFFSQASLYLIQLATVRLFEYIAMTNPSLVCLNFPGIGNAWRRLSRDEVLPIISLLPDCVEIWEFE